MRRFEKVLVTGGAGYVGAVLDTVKGHPDLKEVKGDIRDRELLEREIPGTDALIHLACISNDPSCELDPNLGESINYDAFIPMVDIAKQSKVCERAMQKRTTTCS